eukprot:TRINITY_DN814_c0_g1_i2.p1 TRINITY_DN814_c0_g1~~TRINITY_DN814_c0_g1_i2.p1  ORF type:complete len:197 (+),score=33.72 TRINITY_DN814_c0_g1_i2:485-1075(+)
MENDTSGFIVWPFSLLMCKYVISNSHIFENKSVCEVGAGAGLTSVVIAKYCQNIVTTDGHSGTVDLLNHNMLLNQDQITTNFSCQQLLWGEDVGDLANSFDIVVGASLAYKKSDFDPLFKSAKDLLNDKHDSFFVLTYEKLGNSLEKLISQSASLVGLERVQFDVEDMVDLLNQYGETQLVDYGDDVALAIYKKSI